jgi:hypothetical protein
MKTRRFSMMAKNILAGILIAVIYLSSSSCSRKISFQRSSLTPAAEGYVKVTTDHNNNYLIKIAVDHLVGVEGLSESKKTYVVWMVTDRQETENIGQLMSSTGFLSKKLKASFETVSSFKPVRIFISAEEDESVQSPGELIVLSTENFWD